MGYDPLWDDDDGEELAIDELLTDEERDAKREADTDGDDLTPEQLAAALAKFEAKRFEAVPYNFKATKKRIALVDCETDPFEHGLIIKPFAIGCDFGDRYLDWIGDDCVDQFFAYVATLDEDWIFYAHNGGKFDFFFFLKYLDQEQTPLIMNGRLVKIFFGKQEFRDSFAIIPQPLSAYKKDEISYDKFKRKVRLSHMPEIRSYLKGDCVYARELVVGFHELFGDKLTIASAALPMLNNYHGFERIKSEKMDERFRDYYYGGRVQCLERGLLVPKPGGAWKVYDRNSMYPAVMRDCLHPISARATLQMTISEQTDFAYIDATSWGALPLRAEDGSLDFPMGRHKFHATIHEINAGLETNTLRIHRVIHAWGFDKRVSFEEFVMRFYGLRLDAKAVDDKVRDILYKFCLNSAYGKFALNPRKFKQWMFTVGEIPQPQASNETPKGWSLEVQSGDIFIWSRPNPRRGGFYNVATAASITGAARANLWLNINQSKRPIYCDTDSIICEGFHGALDETALGGWKLEATGTRAAIAGKKLYAVFNNDEAIKKAAKGVGISAQDIEAICRGKTIHYEQAAPTFHLDGSASFISRNVRMTGNKP